LDGYYQDLDYGSKNIFPAKKLKFKNLFSIKSRSKKSLNIQIVSYLKNKEKKKNFESKEIVVPENNSILKNHISKKINHDKSLNNQVKSILNPNMEEME